MRIGISKLKDVIVSILMSSGIGADEAALVAESLSMAEARGISTHGLNFVPMVLDRIAAGLVVVPTTVTTISDSGATVHLDGGNGLGQPAASEAMQRAIEKAREYGIGMALLRNTNHIGLLAFYTQMAAAQGMVGICSCNSAPAMAPWGGTEAFFGTNPFSVAAPSESGQPVVLDMSTSVVARGKIRRAARLHEPIPKDWAFDASGLPTKDPEAALKGTLTPIGGPKGYGLSFFVDLLSGLLSGSSFSRNVSTFHRPICPTGVGAMAIAIDVARFMPIAAFETLMGEHVKSIRESPKAGGTGRIFLPGEIEAEREAIARREGVEIDDDIVVAVERILKERDIRVSLASSTEE